MIDNQKKLEFLLRQLEILQRKQELFSKEISEIKTEVYQLQQSLSKSTEPIQKPVESPSQQPKRVEITREKIDFDFKKERTQSPSPITLTPPPRKKKSLNIENGLEKFIGENLINKIGIVITVIGVAIGAKYSIEHELISPLTRIVLGYFSGLVLLGFGIKLKAKFENYSAVLVSGAMAIMYFITFAGYSFYDLFPQLFAFALMVVFTGFTVVAAINYKRVVIAHIGLVGAYFVPFLLSNNSGHVEVLFSYMAIINTGILIIAFKHHWKSLFYSAFGITWLIFMSWYFTDYNTDEYFTIALTFVTVFFLVFYVTFLAYKIIRNEVLGKENIMLLLLNSFLFYGIGYSILILHDTGEQLLGVFTLVNAIIHFTVSRIIHSRKLGDKKFLHFILGLVLVFITLAIPVQLDGNWVTLLWIGQAAVLFWVGRSKEISFYELLSYPLMLLATISLMQDFAVNYHISYSLTKESAMPFLLNVNFLSSLLYLFALGFIYWIMKDYKTAITKKFAFLNVSEYIIPGAFLVMLFYTFQIEIITYWNQLYRLSMVENLDGLTIYNYDYLRWSSVWVTIYSLFFATVLSLVNIKKLHNVILGYVNLGLNSLVLFLFLIAGLFQLSELRDSFLEQPSADYFTHGVFSIWIRYVVFIAAAALLWVTNQFNSQEFFPLKFKKIFELVLLVSIVWVLASELLQWLDFAEAKNSYKLGLSILFGSYSLLLVVIGIWKRKQHIRILAFAIFGLTLLKLFFYDISHLTTIAKTIVFVSLGVLLLIISFLYNKFKLNIADENEK